MKFVPAKCPTCQGDLQIPDDREFVKCMYCGVEIKVRDVIYLVESHKGDIPFWFLEAKKLLKEVNKSERDDFKRELGKTSIRQTLLFACIDLYDKILLVNPRNIEAIMGKIICYTKIEYIDILPIFLRVNRFYRDSQNLGRLYVFQNFKETDVNNLNCYIVKGDYNFSENYDTMISYVKNLVEDFKIDDSVLLKLQSAFLDFFGHFDEYMMTYLISSFHSNVKSMMDLSKNVNSEYADKSFFMYICFLINGTIIVNDVAKFIGKYSLPLRNKIADRIQTLMKGVKYKENIKIKGFFRDKYETQINVYKPDLFYSEYFSEWLKRSENFN